MFSQSEHAVQKFERITYPISKISRIILEIKRMASANILNFGIDRPGKSWRSVWLVFENLECGISSSPKPWKDTLVIVSQYLCKKHGKDKKNIQQLREIMTKLERHAFRYRLVYIYCVYMKKIAQTSFVELLILPHVALFTGRFHYGNPKPDHFYDFEISTCVRGSQNQSFGLWRHQTLLLIE